MTNILLIEPDTKLSNVYKKALEHIGWQVTTASTAQDAIYAADQESPDLVILELQMPGHNGVEFLYEFRSYPDWQAVPVIIHSLVPTAELQAPPTVWQELAIANYLYKPRTSLQQLIRSVREVLVYPKQALEP